MFLISLVWTMSEHLRHLSPASSSPGRQHQIARPDWPWAARSYSQRSQQSSPHPIQGSSLQSGWETRTSLSSTSTQSSSGAYSGTPQGRNSATPRPPYNSAMSPAESTKQWTFTVNEMNSLLFFNESYCSGYIGV